MTKSAQIPFSSWLPAAMAAGACVAAPESATGETTNAACRPAGVRTKSSGHAKGHTGYRSITQDHAGPDTGYVCLCKKCEMGEQ